MGEKILKRDPYNNQRRWNSWKRDYKTPPEKINKTNWKIFIQFLEDMELGINTPKEKKGKRDVGTLLNLSSHNQFFLKNLNKPLKDITKQDLHNLEKKVLEGKILKRNKQKFTAFGNYIKDFKVFWNYLLRTHQVKENIIEDISSKTDKPNWVYLTEDQVKTFFNSLSFDYRVLCWFLYDSGMRVTELNSIKIKDFEKGFGKVTISDEVSKTFGRTINLKLSSQLLQEYVKNHKLLDEDFLLIKKPFSINMYLKHHCGKMFGKDKESHPKSKGKYGQFTIYDIRHNSACYWFNRYPTHKGLMYRFGWRNPDKIEYYSGFLGVSDPIEDKDMVIGEDKSKLDKMEKEMDKLKEDLELIKQVSKSKDKVIGDSFSFQDRLQNDPKFRKDFFKNLKGIDISLKKLK